MRRKNAGTATRDLSNAVFLLIERLPQSVPQNKVTIEQAQPFLVRGTSSQE
jgi:hypothetical protein